MDPKVSVLLPFYNAGEMLDTAIAGITAQSLSHWELLLINNNTSDSSLQTAEQWCKKDPRIRLLHEQQQGIAFALNHGLAQAGGKYIARMDADDNCAPQRLEKQVAFLDGNPDIGVAGTQCLFHSQLEQSSGYAHFVSWQNDILSAEDHACNRFIESPLAHPSVMFRRELPEQYGNYSTEAVPEDYELWLRWMEHGVQFAKIPEALLQWNDHAGRLSRQHPNCSDEAFYRVKCLYLARYIKQHIDPAKKIVVCGTGKLSRTRARLLEQHGITIHGFTDVHSRQLKGLRFIPLQELGRPEPWLLLNFISKQGVNNEIRSYLLQKGYREMLDFILAA